MRTTRADAEDLKLISGHTRADTEIETIPATPSCSMQGHPRERGTRALPNDADADDGLPARTRRTLRRTGSEQVVARIPARARRYDTLAKAFLQTAGSPARTRQRRGIVGGTETCNPGLPARTRKTVVPAGPFAMGEAYPRERGSTRVQDCDS